MPINPIWRFSKKMNKILTVNNAWNLHDFEDLRRLGIKCFRVNGIHLQANMLSVLETIHDNEMELFFDLPGTKCRIWNTNAKKETVSAGDRICIHREGKGEGFYITGENLWRNVVNDDLLFVRRINRDPVRLKVIENNKEKIIVEVLSSGIIGNGYHIYDPFHYWGNHCLSIDDRKQKTLVDRLMPQNIAVSFADTAEVIQEARSYFGPEIKYFAKVESPEGIKNLDSIIEIADGIIIGRDDLSAYYQCEEIESLVEEILMRCRIKGKPCIGASNYLQNIYDTGSMNEFDVEAYNRLKSGNAHGIYINETNKDVQWRKYVEALCKLESIVLEGRESV